MLIIYLHKYRRDFPPYQQRQRNIPTFCLNLCSGNNDFPAFFQNCFKSRLNLIYIEMNEHPFFRRNGNQKHKKLLRQIHPLQ